MQLNIDIKHRHTKVFFTYLLILQHMSLLSSVATTDAMGRSGWGRIFKFKFIIHIFLLVNLEAWIAGLVTKGSWVRILVEPLVNICNTFTTPLCLWRPYLVSFTQSDSETYRYTKSCRSVLSGVFHSLP